MSSVAWPAEGGEEKGEMVLGCYGGLYIIGLSSVCVSVYYLCMHLKENIHKESV